MTGKPHETDTALSDRTKGPGRNAGASIQGKQEQWNNAKANQKTDETSTNQKVRKPTLKGKPHESDGKLYGEMRRPGRDAGNQHPEDNELTNAPLNYHRR